MRIKSPLNMKNLQGKFGVNVIDIPGLHRKAGQNGML